MTDTPAERSDSAVSPELDPRDPRTELMRNVRNALAALPIHFQSVTNMEGLDATDLFALNTVLGATIEVQVVEALNRMREVWDPRDEWPLYQFERQAQTFPDVLLRRRAADTADDIALGIELKGWYLLAKESEPSFRYRVTAAACSDWDLLAVVPWCLSNVLAGQPRVWTPGIWSARYAAEYRNHWWQHIRDARSDTAIRTPDGATPYSGRDHTVDQAVADGGSNFGRIARIGIMNDWTETTIRKPLAGIPVRDWITFLRRHTDHSDPDEVWSILSAEASAVLTQTNSARSEEILETLRRLTALLTANEPR